ncbi:MULTISPECIES: DUF1289 domain-containing protein [Acidovorax]|uniref:DUF1289 domain-containing protein n=1 Tax=Acidovorax TaxID=12916 RepID=UPI0002FE4024|nr:MULTISPECIES: DUF1289 domain-containing protein [Acidovorax]KRD47813.1 hypothetical protein ASE52_10315 [Acidovorax sp. Root275]
MSAIDLLAARALKISAEGHFDAENIEAVPSPCISVCRMSPDRSHCEGCFRTLDEIRIWSRADASLRRGIWAQLLDRAGIEVTPQEIRP